MHSNAFVYIEMRFDMDVRTEIKVFVSIQTHCAPSLPVHSDGQKATHWRHDRDADHGVKHIVHLPDEVVLHHQLSVVEEVNDDGLPGIGHTHQHVSYCQTAMTKRGGLTFDHKHRLVFLFMFFLPEIKEPAQKLLLLFFWSFLLKVQAYSLLWSRGNWVHAGVIWVQEESFKEKHNKI